MASYRCYLNVTLCDSDGDLSKQRIDLGPLPDTDTIAGLNTVMQGYLTALGGPGTITNACVTEASISIVISKATFAAALNAQYSQVEDQARLQFANSAGDRASLSIPAPIAAVFSSPPNQDTVNFAGAIAPVIAWFTAHAGGPALLNIYEGGVKVARRARIRAQHRV